MKRVMIFGGSGSGKSTLARKIGASTGLPVVHIDPMYYKPGWVQRPKEKTRELVLVATTVPALDIIPAKVGPYMPPLSRAEEPFYSKPIPLVEILYFPSREKCAVAGMAISNPIAP